MTTLKYGTHGRGIVVVLFPSNVATMTDVSFCTDGTLSSC